VNRRSPARPAILLFLLVPGALAQEPPPVFRAGVEAVFVDVVVTRGGRPLPGLLAKDFLLKDDGVPQRLELVSAETRPLTSLLVFDTSSSMEEDRLSALRLAGEAFLDGLRPADPAGLLAFSEEIAWQSRPSTDRGAIKSALAGLKAGGATSVLDALFVAISLADTGSRPLIVLFTDGEDNTSWLGAPELRSVADRSNALIYVVSWQPKPVLVRGKLDAPPLESEQDRALREIAESTGGKVWRADSPARLREAFAAISDAMGHRYVLRYEPEGVGHTGLHHMEVGLCCAKGDVQARRGYWVPPARDERTPNR
jgi:VWFA-related protein